MKYTFITFLIFYGVTAHAQQKDFFKSKPWETEKKKLLSMPLFKLQPEMENNILPEKEESLTDLSVLTIPLKGKYLTNNELGADVYAMSTDNMPCLFPNKTFSFKMPVAGKQNPSKEISTPRD